MFYTRCAATAVDTRGHIVSRGTSNVFPSNVADFQAARIAVLVAVDTRRDVYRLIDVLKLDVAEGDVLHMALARVCLDPGRVGTMNSSDVFEEHVVYRLGNVRGITH